MTNDFLLLVARVGLAVVFLVSGVEKFADIAGTASYIASGGLPAAVPLAWASAFFETLSAVAILTGAFTQFACWLLALFCAFTAAVFHAKAVHVAGFPEAANRALTGSNQIMMMKNLAMAGGFLALSVAGPGAWSVDALRRAAPARS